MVPLTIVQAAISWSGHNRADTQDSGKGSHWVEAAIEAVYELIQIRRQVLLTHAMMSAQQPSFQVGEDQVNHWQRLLRFFHIAIKHNQCMVVPECRQVVVADPAIGRDSATGQNVFGDKRVQ